MEEKELQSVEQPELDTPRESSAKKRKSANNTNSWQGTILMYLHDLVYLLAGLILLFLLLFRVVVVSGTSMNNTLLHGDYLLLLSSTLYNNPKCGDIIVASKESFNNGEPIVKRVIATEGQWVDIDFKTGTIYVGDTEDTMKPLDEPYILPAIYNKRDVDFPLQVQEGCLFVMGDNRGNSLDSRSSTIGLVDEREVLGKVFFLLVPGTNGVDDYGRPNQEKDFDRIGEVN